MDAPSGLPSSPRTEAVQTAFDWDPGVDVFLGWFDCGLPGQVTSLVPTGPGAVAGTLVSGWDCIAGGVGVPVGSLLFLKVAPIGETCVSIIQTDLPGGTAVASCAADLVPIDPDCWGRICYLSGGIHTCDCDFAASIESAPQLSPSVMLSQPVPNPIAKSMTYSVALEKEAQVRVEVFDVSGRIVSEPLRETLSAGVHTFAWSSVDESGRDLPAGAYYLSLEAGGARESRKFVVIR